MTAPLPHGGAVLLWFAFMAIGIFQIQMVKQLQRRFWTKTPNCIRLTHERLAEAIARQDKPANRLNYQKFSKTKLATPEAIKTPVLRQISREHFREIGTWSADDILSCCDFLLATDERYMRFFAFDWAFRIKKHYVGAHFKIFERWLMTYVDGWGSCDHVCCGALGHLLLRYPDLAGKTRSWRKSGNLWMRRAAAVSLIVPVRKGLLLDEVRDCAEVLLEDSEDMVQKGYGWMLKEATKQYPREIFSLVMAHKGNMPRTALRYAIEKLPEAERRQAMNR